MRSLINFLSIKTDNMLALALHQCLFKIVLLAMLFLLISLTHIKKAYAFCSMKDQSIVSATTIPPINIDPSLPDGSVLTTIPVNVNLAADDYSCTEGSQLKGLLIGIEGTFNHNGSYYDVYDTAGNKINTLGLQFFDFEGNKPRSGKRVYRFSSINNESITLKLVKINGQEENPGTDKKIKPLTLYIKSTDISDVDNRPSSTAKKYIVYGASVRTLSSCQLISASTQTVDFGSVAKNDITATGPTRPFSIRVECKTNANIDLMIRGKRSGTHTTGVLQNVGNAAGVGVQILEESILKDGVAQRNGATAITTLNSTESFSNAKTFEFNYSARLYPVGQLGAGDVKAELNFILQPK